ncbi:CpaF family protein [Acetobacter papayae]|uniref:CpaF family protein n=1 Tax=Acetobacter papayae TaxID=1076592 RepID=UPI0039ECDE3D
MDDTMPPAGRASRLQRLHDMQPHAQLPEEGAGRPSAGPAGGPHPAQDSADAGFAPAPGHEAAERRFTSEQILSLRALCLGRLDPAVILALEPEQLAGAVERVVDQAANEQRIRLNLREQQKIAAELVNDIKGLGPVQPLLDDDSISDILINGPKRIFVERYGKTELSPAQFRDQRHLVSVCQRVASEMGRRIDEASPMVDARLRDGSRVNIVFPPLALDGPYMSIRKFSKNKIDLQKLVEYGSCSPAVATILEIASRVRLNIIVSGGTGSGKTTLLNALSRFIDFSERIITVEDAAELQLQQPHVVRMETRPPSIEGKGEVTQRDLVRNALRMRPDRIIVGEVRGAEAFDMLQAMNTGHDGSMSSIHSNNTREAITRVESMVQMGSFGLPVHVIRTQIVGAVDLIVQVGRNRDGVRRIMQVTDVAGVENGTVVMNDLFRLGFDGEDSHGRLISHYDVSNIRPSFHEKLEYYQMDGLWNATLADNRA